jgi:hypothetical protein
MILRAKVILFALVLSTLLGSAVPNLSADPYTPRQYYGNWKQHTSKTYYYRPYYYKPSPTYSGYKHHYVIYYPSRPTYYYYYNSYTRTYWGRCPVKTDGKGEYSLLADADRKGNIEEIPEKAFPPMAKLPKMPEATDDATLDLPPDDLPTVEKTP